MFYVYLLRSMKNGSLYIGHTNNLSRRLLEHNSGANQSTKNRGPFDLVYYEAYKALEDAKHREEMLKLFGRALGGLKRRIKFSLSAN